MGLALAIFFFGLLGGFESIVCILDGEDDFQEKKDNKDDGYFSNKWYP